MVFFGAELLTATREDKSGKERLPRVMVYSSAS